MRRSLTARAFGGLAFLVLMLGLALFVPAGSLDYWQAWVYLAVFLSSTLAITVRLMRTDRALLERRMAVGAMAEKERMQKLIQLIAQFAFLALLVVPALDHRFGWSRAPAWAVAAGDALLAAGMFIVFLVFRENSFASATIAVGADQPVVSTGPYARVRHPMYAGALLLLVGTPPALGSWWGLLATLPITAVIVWRMLDEERFLAANLRGYGEYREKVRRRLIPGVF